MKILAIKGNTYRQNQTSFTSEGLEPSIFDNEIFLSMSPEQRTLFNNELQSLKIDGNHTIARVCGREKKYGYTSTSLRYQVEVRVSGTKNLVRLFSEPVAIESSESIAGCLIKVLNTANKVLAKKFTKAKI